jgi:hypothetical protein
MNQRTGNVDTFKISNPENSKKKEKIYFITGITFPLIVTLGSTLVVSLFNLSSNNIFSVLGNLSFYLFYLSIIVAIVLLFIKKYHRIAKKYLFGATLGFIGGIFLIFFITTAWFWFVQVPKVGL